MLELKNICYSVKENGKLKVILDNINFSCEENEMIAITGKNGSGKSTLLKIIMGIIKPTCGTILFNKKNITNFDISERAKLGIAYSFQNPISFKGITVRDLLNISFGDNNKTVNDYCEILSNLGLCAIEYLDREINNKLSGGEQKRIDIASVLARQAKLNLFDEPESGIDIWSFDNLVNIFKNIKASNIIVSHQKKLIKQADKILILDNGKIIAFDKTKIVIPTLNENGYCKKLRSKNG
ncbi:MAG: ABC transporter ATP-binding protein [Clostridia bacterium]|nr:ABC transporter ATP-binding protein [Clostridia bacterium]